MYLCTDERMGTQTQWLNNMKIFILILLLLMLLFFNHHRRAIVTLVLPLVFLFSLYYLIFFLSCFCRQTFILRTMFCTVSSLFFFTIYFHHSMLLARDMAIDNDDDDVDDALRGQWTLVSRCTTLLSCLIVSDHVDDVYQFAKNDNHHCHFN